MTFSFFVTAAHALAKGAEAIIRAGRTFIPGMQTAVATATAVAVEVDPKDAALISAVSQASQAMLGKALDAANGAAALEEAEKSGTLTIPATVDEIKALQALYPSVAEVVHSLGLGHTLKA